MISPPPASPPRTCGFVVVVDCAHPLAEALVGLNWNTQHVLHKDLLSLNYCCVELLRAIVLTFSPSPPQFISTTASTAVVRPASAVLEVLMAYGLLFVLLLAVAPVVLLMMLCCSRRRRVDNQIIFDIMLYIIIVVVIVIISTIKE